MNHRRGNLWLGLVACFGVVFVLVNSHPIIGGMFGCGAIYCAVELWQSR